MPRHSRSRSRSRDRDAYIYVEITAPPILLPVTATAPPSDINPLGAGTIGPFALPGPIVLPFSAFAPNAIPVTTTGITFTEDNVISKDDFKLENGVIIVKKTGWYEFSYVIRGFSNLGSVPFSPLTFVGIFPPSPGIAGALLVNGIPALGTVAPMNHTQTGIIKLHKHDRVTIGNADPSGPAIFLSGPTTATSTAIPPATTPPVIVGGTSVGPATSPSTVVASIMLELIDE